MTNQNTSQKKTIVITGNTRGIGYGLADSFLALGCKVIISSRTDEAVQKVVATLATKYDVESVFGFPCDMTDYGQVQALWDATTNHFGQVDFWINNAGIKPPSVRFWEHHEQDIRKVVAINLTGVMYGSHVALQGMLNQGFGSLYNMEGMGSDGRIIIGSTLYGSTKYGLTYLTKSLAEEAEDTPLIIGLLSPGMVVTDLLLGELEQDSEGWEKTKRIFNILADRVETVTPWLAEQIINNTKHFPQIRWLTTPKVAKRFLTAPFRKRDLFSDE